MAATQATRTSSSVESPGARVRQRKAHTQSVPEENSTRPMKGCQCNGGSLENPERRAAWAKRVQICSGGGVHNGSS
eukprot:3758614-Rhodomonas_salina.3